jgi:hypothetical protein
MTDYSQQYSTWFIGLLLGMPLCLSLSTREPEFGLRSAAFKWPALCSRPVAVKRRLRRPPDYEVIIIDNNTKDPAV